MSRTMELINGPIFDEMKRAAAKLPVREPYQYSRSPSCVRPVGFRDGQEAGLSILRLMDRKNAENGSSYRNLPADEAAE